MRRYYAFIVAAFLILALLGAGCAPDEKAYQDGVYSAEFLDFDSYGYKDFLRVTVQDGEVTELLYDGTNADGGLKSEDEKYRNDMETVQSTYPAKYTTDLVNQYMEKQDIEKVDTIAGATYSSDSFRALFKALKDNMENGVTDMVITENVPVK